MTETLKKMKGEFDLPPEVIERVVRSMFKMVMLGIQDNEKDIRVKGLGVFYNRKRKKLNPRTRGAGATLIYHDFSIE